MFSDFLSLQARAAARYEFPFGGPFLKHSDDVKLLLEFYRENLRRAVLDKSIRESEFLSRIGQKYLRNKIHVENC